MRSVGDCIRLQFTATRVCALSILLLALPAWLAAPTATFAQTGGEPPHAPDIDLNPDDDDEEDFEDIDLLELEIPIVVTAGRHAQKLTSVPYAMSVITARDIRRAGARTIPDALRLAAGVDVAHLASGSSAVSARGFHGFVARQILVLVDGRQIFNSLFGGALWHSWPFQLEDIDRIEVIRGPGGVIWGANAVNGVINVITKDPTDQLGLTLSAGGGTRGSFHQHTGYAVRDGKLRFRVSGEYEANDGFREGGSFIRGLEDEYKAGRIGVHAIYETSPTDRFTLSAGHALVDGAYPPPPLAGLALTRNSGSQASFIMGTWKREVAPDNQLELTLYANDLWASQGMPAVDYRYQQVALQLRQTVVPAEAHRLTWGIDTRLDTIDTGNGDPHLLDEDRITSAVVGIYVQDQWQLAERWKLDLGARIDYDTYGGIQPSARAALTHELSDDAILYGAVSRAFQMPPAAVRQLEVPLLNGLAVVDSSRDIDPQSLVAFELGYRGRLFDRVDTSLNFFWHEYDEITTLSPRIGPPGLIALDLDNRARASSYGAELELKYAVTDKLTLLGNYSYTQLDWHASVPLHDSYSMSPPRHKAMLGAVYSPTEDLHLSGYLYYVDAVEAPNPLWPFVGKQIDPYFRLDVRAEYEFREDQVSIAIGARNLLDPDHAEGASLFINDAEVPRMIYAEVRIAIP